MSTRFVFRSLFCLIACLCGAISQATTVILPKPDLDQIYVQVDSSVRVQATVRILDSAVVQNAVLLQRVSTDGKVIKTETRLLDNGQAGDVIAGDNVYSGVFELNASEIGDISFRVLAPFRAGTGIQRSGISIVSVVSKDTPVGIVPATSTPRVSDPVTGGQLVCDELLVKFREGISLHQAREIVQVRIGGTIVGQLQALGVYQVRVPCSNGVALVGFAELLSADIGVEYAEPNGLLELNTNDPYYAQQWALPIINWPSALALTRRRLISVAVVDSGVDGTHPDLVSRGFAGCDLTSSINLLSNTCIAGDSLKDSDSKDYHGTHVAGIIAAANNTIGIAGVCPECYYLSYKVFADNNSNSGLTTTTAAAISKATAANVDVINLSLGSSGQNNVMRDAIKKAISKGIVVVAAAGNASCQKRSFPAGYDGVISVGAIAPDSGRMTANSDLCVDNSGSNFGDDWVDVYAPGADIWSTYKNAGYKSKSGTSMASPVVAGVVGLMLSRNPLLKPAEVRTILRLTARLSSARDPDGRFIRYVDAEAAVRRGDAPPEFTINGDALDDKWPVLTHPSFIRKHYIWSGYSTYREIRQYRDATHLFLLWSEPLTAADRPAGPFPYAPAPAAVFEFYSSKTDSNGCSSIPGSNWEVGLYIQSRLRADAIGVSEGGPWAALFRPRSCSDTGVRFDYSTIDKGQVIWTKADRGDRQVWEIAIPLSSLRPFAASDGLIKINSPLWGQTNPLLINVR